MEAVADDLELESKYIGRVPVSKLARSTEETMLAGYRAW